MYISQHNNPTVADFTKALEDIDHDKLIEPFRDRVKKAHDELYSDLMSNLEVWFKENFKEMLGDAITREAVWTIESLLAGDKDTFAALGMYQHDWRQPSGWWLNQDRLPLGVELRRKLLMHHRDLFESKIISDLEGEVAAVRDASAREIRRLKDYIAQLKGAQEDE